MLTSLLLPIVCAAAAAHPQDGPDIDLRISIASDLVQCQIVMNLACTDALVGKLRENADVLHPVEHDALRGALEDFFRKNNKVTVDGIVVPFVAKSFSVQEPDLKLLPLFPRFGRLSITKCRIVLDYPLKQAPKQVALVWGAYPPDVFFATPDGVPPLEVRAQLLADGGMQLINFTKDEPEYVWHAPTKAEAKARFLPVPKPVVPPTLELPVISVAVGLVLAVATLAFAFVRDRRRYRKLLVSGWVAGIVVATATLGVARASVRDPFAAKVVLPDQAQALAIFGPLHANIYRAFDYTSESDIYDALAQSVHGRLLDSLYNQVYQSLVMRDQGGAVARVKKVTPVTTDVEEIGVLPPDQKVGFRVKARWRVAGEVFHWGHSHTRVNEYLARYTVEGDGGAWRITGNEVLEQKRVGGEPEGR